MKACVIQIMAILDTNQIRYLNRTKRAGPVPLYNARWDSSKHCAQVFRGHTSLPVNRIGIEPRHGVHRPTKQEKKIGRDAGLGANQILALPD